MNDAPVKSPHYILVVDKKVNEILSCMLQAAAINSIVFNLLLTQQRVSKEDLIAFINDMSAKEHLLGWCTDPNCKGPQKV